MSTEFQDLPNNVLWYVLWNLKHDFIYTSNVFHDYRQILNSTDTLSVFSSFGDVR